MSTTKARNTRDRRSFETGGKRYADMVKRMDTLDGSLAAELEVLQLHDAQLLEWRNELVKRMDALEHTVATMPRLEASDGGLRYVVPNEATTKQ